MPAAQATKEEMSMPVFSLAASAASPHTHFCKNEPTEAQTRIRGFNPENTALISPSAWLSSTLQPACEPASNESAVAQLVQRYYSSALGRFMTPDPYRANGGGSGNPGNSQSWNRYTYVQSDPVNFIDPRGRDLTPPLDCFVDGDYDASIACESGDGFIAPNDPPPTTPSQIWNFRKSILLAAAAYLATNISRTSSTTQIPTYLQLKSECWAPSSGQQSASYTLEVTYQIEDQNGKPISGNALSGVSIAEQIFQTSGNLGVTAGPPWQFGTDTGIQSDGTFTDYLSSGSFGIIVRSGTALQTFSAQGTIGGVPFFQPLLINGFGPTTSVLANTYSQYNVTINARGLGQDPATECPTH